MKKIFLISALTVFAVFLSLDYAGATKMTVKRMIFEGSNRSDSFVIINSEPRDVTYRLGWRHFLMTEDKVLKTIDPEDPLPDAVKPVVDMVRFAPRRFVVPAFSSQQVRFVLRMPSDLPDGEYRSHFWVQPEPEVDELKVKGRAETKPGKAGVRLKVLTGMTVPVIVRKGSLSSTSGISGLSVSDAGGEVKVSFSLLREGDKSTYGNLRFVCNPGSESYLLKQTKGVAVYTEVNKRNFNLDIPKKLGEPECRSLEVSYIGTDKFKAEKGEVLTQATAQVL